MAFGEFVQRQRALLAKNKKITASASALGVLGVATIVAASWSLTASHTTESADPALRASVTECHDMVTISVAGRGDTPVAGTTRMLVDANGNELPAAVSGDHSSQWLDPVVNAPRAAEGEDSYQAVYIAYPANMASYEDAVNTGVANTQQVMRDISVACPNTKFSIVGYSEGADVVRRVAMKIGNGEPDANGRYETVNPDDVVGVVILADSGRSEGEGPFIGAKNPYGNPDNFDTKYQNGTGSASGSGALPGNSGGFGKLGGKIASFCSDGDLTCAAPKNISLLQLVVNVGRQINADQLEKEGLNPVTGQDVAVNLANIAMKAFADIQSQKNWMASDETFLSVLLRVSDPNYKPGESKPQTQQADSIAAENMSPLAYLPQKVFNEIIGLITTNQNTIPVILSDPYNLTLGPNGTGHHFDYWRDAKPEDGKQLTSAEYAAAWLTELAKKAQAGELKTTTTTKPAEKAALAASSSGQPSTTTGKPSTTSGTTTSGGTTSGTTTTAPTTTTTTTTPAPPTTTVEAVAPATTTPEAVKPTTTAPTTTTVPATTAPATTTAAK
ncbi:cutinase family protein [Nocardia yamanashiensis]|uniref:cutinase family protein n=1 Tax=Nocardia yamanashiensis TaxID=209247 RepID=UPI0008330F98|nr:cutinase family protein [Nocardia yamanashiensis]